MTPDAKIRAMQAEARERGDTDGAPGVIVWLAAMVVVAAIIVAWAV